MPESSSRPFLHNGGCVCGGGGGEREGRLSLAEEQNVLENLNYRTAGPSWYPISHTPYSHVTIAESEVATCT